MFAAVIRDQVLSIDTIRAAVPVGLLRMIGMKLDYETPNFVRFWQRRNLRRSLRLATLPLLLALIISLTLFFPGVFYRHREEVDIRSGRIRRSDYILFIRVRQTVEASPLSQALAGIVRSSGPSDWRVVSTFEGTSRVSPHYNFHGATAQITRLEALWQLVPFTAEAKQQIAATVLALWQNGGNDWNAGEYVSAVEDLALEHEQSDQPIGAGQLPTSFSSTRPTAWP